MHLRLSGSGQDPRSCALTSTPVVLVPLVPGSCLEERVSGELRPFQMWFARMLFMFTNCMGFIEFQEDLFGF